MQAKIKPKKQPKTPKRSKASYYAAGFERTRRNKQRRASARSVRFVRLRVRRLARADARFARLRAVPAEVWNLVPAREAKWFAAETRRRSR